MDKAFEQALWDSMYVHFPLAVDREKTLETRVIQKPVLHRVILWDGKNLEPWSFEGSGEARLTPEGTLALTTGSRSDSWPAEEARAANAATGAYATFGSYIARLNLKGIDMSRGNRIWFQVRPACPGLHSPIMRAAFVNNGARKIPDAYSREGFNALNLNNFAWNTCVWEIDAMAHDRVEELSFQVHRYGKELSGGDTLFFELRDIQFQEVHTDIVHGWRSAKETAVFSSLGYPPEGIKTAIANTAAKTFEVITPAGGIAFSGPVKTVVNRWGSFGVLDFSSLTTPGTYQIRFGSSITTAFRIDPDIFEGTLWKLINFLYCERCGYPVPGKHGSCHSDVVAEFQGLTIPYQGGWHDAADVSQQTVQSAEILHALLENVMALGEKNPLLRARLMEEAHWGLDFMLRMRLGDGYRVTSSGIRRWTDGLIGNMDDCEARVHNHSFENFIIAGTEAAGAVVFAKADPALAWKCTDAAREDFDFGLRRFLETGLEAPVPQEHAGSASLSQYYAALCWAAAHIYRITGEEKHRDAMTAYGKKLLACQETGGAHAPLKGYFYRDETQKAIVHFSHQARDQIFVQALAELCTALPDHQDRPQWEGAMRLFGDYLKGLAAYTAPYGMLPAGIHAADEPEDRETFEAIHPQVDYQKERENYREQLNQAIALGEGYAIKCFPVWFSYRGNSAVHLSMGKAASLLGLYFNDRELIEIAREQLYWTLGKNPFGQSLIYGEGYNYGQQYAALLGETVGEMPVGIQTRGNEDLPYWPQANIATYREVWTTPPGRWFWITADLLRIGPSQAPGTHAAKE